MDSQLWVAVLSQQVGVFLDGVLLQLGTEIWLGVLSQSCSMVSRPVVVAQLGMGVFLPGVVSKLGTTVPKLAVVFQLGPVVSELGVMSQFDTVVFQCWKQVLLWPTA